MRILDGVEIGVEVNSRSLLLFLVNIPRQMARLVFRRTIGNVCAMVCLDTYPTDNLMILLLRVQQSPDDPEALCFKILASILGISLETTANA